MAEHVYSPPVPAAVKAVTPPPTAIIIPFRGATCPEPRAALRPMRPGQAETIISSVDAIAPDRLLQSALTALTLSNLQTERGATPPASAVLRAFLCLARALDDAGLPVGDLIGGAA